MKAKRGQNFSRSSLRTARGQMLRAAKKAGDARCLCRFVVTNRSGTATDQGPDGKTVEAATPRPKNRQQTIASSKKYERKPEQHRNHGSIERSRQIAQERGGGGFGHGRRVMNGGGLLKSMLAESPRWQIGRVWRTREVNTGKSEEWQQIIDVYVAAADFLVPPDFFLQVLIARVADSFLPFLQFSSFLPFSCSFPKYRVPVFLGFGYSNSTGPFAVARVVLLDDATILLDAGDFDAFGLGNIG